MKAIAIRATSCAAMAALLLAAAARTQVSGNGKANRLEGTWRTQGTAINCQTGAPIRTFQGLSSFLPDGSNIATGASNPALMSSGHGVWEHTEGRTFTNTLVFFRFNADGSFAGTQKVTRTIELDGSGDAFMSTNSLEIADASGNVIATACSTETGHRL